MNPDSRKIDINTASISALIQLPQVGPALASEIIAARPYARLSELKLVSGIGEKIYTVLKDYLRVATDSVVAAAHLSDNAISSSSLIVSGKLDINRASIQELQDVPGIGLALAKTIVAGRPYGRLPDLRKVSGVGHKLYAGLHKYLRVPTSRSSSDRSEQPRLEPSSKRKYNSTSYSDEILEMPSFEDDTSSVLSVSDYSDSRSEDSDPVEVDTVKELIGPPIIDGGGQVTVDLESSGRVSADSVKIVNKRLRSDWQPVNIAIRPYRRRRRWRLIAAAVIAGSILGVLQTYGLLGKVISNPMGFLSIGLDEQLFLESEQEDQLQGISTSTIVIPTVVSSQIAISQSTLTAMVVETSSVIKVTSASTQTVSEISSVVITPEVEKIPTVTPIVIPTMTQMPTPTKAAPIPQSVRNLNPTVVPRFVLWEEGFEPLRFANWGRNETENWYSGIEDGVFRLITKQRNKQFYSSAPESNLVERNFYYEGDVIVEYCTGKDFYGLLFKAKLDVDEYFAATITCEGNYRLISKMNGIYEDLRIAASDVVPQGPGIYRLGILLKGDSFSLHVDGLQVHTYTWDGLDQVASGEFGVYARSVESDELKVSWDNLIATELER